MTEESQPLDDQLERLYALMRAIPDGASEGMIADRRYRIAVRRQADGKINSLQAWEYGDKDYISLNFYRLENGKLLLKPCEMPVEKVADFILNIKPTPSE